MQFYRYTKSGPCYFWVKRVIAVVHTSVHICIVELKIIGSACPSVKLVKKKETLRGYVFESCHVQFPASCSYSYVLKQAIWMALQLEHVHHMHFQQFIIIEDCPCTQMTNHCLSMKLCVELVMPIPDIVYM